MKRHKILSIDAWADCEPKSWNWNAWYIVGHIDHDKIPEKDCKVIRWLINNGFIRQDARRRVYVEDDGYNLVICARKDHMPLFAIEYGCSEEGEE